MTSVAPGGGGRIRIAAEQRGERGFKTDRGSHLAAKQFAQVITGFEPGAGDGGNDLALQRRDFFPRQLAGQHGHGGGDELRMEGV